MDTDKLLDTLRELAADAPWAEIATYGVPAFMLALLAWSALGKEPDRRLSRLSTLLGMAWMAQGMWEVATVKLAMPVFIAGALFLVFESMLATGIFRAERFRADLPRRNRAIRWVWTLATVAGVIVAIAEGWAQAPLRFAVPLLVVANWYMDLTADDDPGERQATSWQWTPRNALLALGALRPGADDVQTLDREFLRAKMVKLAFRIEHGDSKMNDFFHRKLRLDKLKTLADDTDMAEVRARLLRSRIDLFEAPKPERPVRQPALPPTADLTGRTPQGVHSRDGRLMRGAELEADAVLLMQRSIAQGNPLSTDDLRDQYAPRLGERKAQEFAAKGRKTNGHSHGLSAENDR